VQDQSLAAPEAEPTSNAPTFGEKAQEGERKLPTVLGEHRSAECDLPSLPFCKGFASMGTHAHSARCHTEEKIERAKYQELVCLGSTSHAAVYRGHMLSYCRLGQ